MKEQRAVKYRPGGLRPFLFCKTFSIPRRNGLFTLPTFISLAETAIFNVERTYLKGILHYDLQGVVVLVLLFILS